jgi:hypothetical protein
VRASGRGDCAGEGDVPLLQPEDTAGEPHAETIVRHREQRHPVVDALRAEERRPTLLAHLPRLETQLLRSPTERMSRPVRRELTHTGYLQQRWPAGR